MFPFFDKMCRSPILRNSLYLLTEKFILLGAGLLFTVILSRYWTVNVFGDFQYLLALLALLTPFYTLGLNSLVSGLVVKFPADSGSIMGTAMILRSGGATLGLLIGLGVSYWYVDERFGLLMLALLLSQLVQVLSVVEFFFEAKVQSKVSAIIRSSVGLTFMLLKTFAVGSGEGLVVVLILTCIEWLMLGIMWLVAYQAYGDGIARLCWSSEQAKYLLSRCGWLFFSSIAAIVYLKIDQVMLGQLVDSEAVAYYSVASRLSEVWYLIPSILVASCYPDLIRAKQQPTISPMQDSAGYQHLLQLWCNGLCWLAIFIALVMTFMAPLLIELLFGVRYAPAAIIVQIHIWAGVFIFMRALFSKWILIEDIPRYSLLTHGFGALVNVLLNFYFIPLYAGVGAAIATLISYAVASYLALFMFTSTRPMAWLMTRSLLFPIRYFYNKQAQGRQVG
jgi:O-antigen/teichoic acid export membrane protein